MESFEKRREDVIAVVLNLLYMVFGGSLFGCMVWHHQVLLTWHMDDVTGLGICGVILITVATFGIVFLILNKQKLILLYCVGLSALVLAIGVLGGSCVATDSSHIIHSLVGMWTRASPTTKQHIQTTLDCCGFENPNFPLQDPLHLSHPSCTALPCCERHPGSPCCSGHAFVTGQPCPCNTCAGILEDHVDRTLRTAGFVALATSMTLLFGTTWVLVQVLQRHRDRQIEEEQEEQQADSNTPYSRF